MHFYSLIGIIAFGLLGFGFSTADIALATSRTPTEVSTRSLKADDLGGNAHIELTDVFLCPRYAMRIGGSLWVPVLERGSELNNAIDAYEAIEGNTAAFPAPSGFGVMVKLDGNDRAFAQMSHLREATFRNLWGETLSRLEQKKLRELRDVKLLEVWESVIEERGQNLIDAGLAQCDHLRSVDHIRGVVLNDIEPLGESERAALQDAFPAMDLDTCLILDADRKTPGRTAAIVMLTVGSLASAFLLGRLMAFWSRRSRNRRTA